MYAVPPSLPLPALSLALNLVRLCFQTNPNVDLLHVIAWRGAYK